MITLASGCLLFQMGNGETIPFSAEMIEVELLGQTTERFDEEFVRQAAMGVFHYFQHDLGRQTVTIAEFASSLEKVLHGFHIEATAMGSSLTPVLTETRAADLCQLARESGDARELFFFPRLRDEVRQQLQHQPRLLRFHGLRDCVKHLMGTRRWTTRCRSLEEQIVTYLRECLCSEARAEECSLRVE